MNCSTSWVARSTTDPLLLHHSSQRMPPPHRWAAFLFLSFPGVLLYHEKDRYSLNSVLSKYDLPTRLSPVTIFINPLSFDSISCCIYAGLSIFMFYKPLTRSAIVYITDFWQFDHKSAAKITISFLKHKILLEILRFHQSHERHLRTLLPAERPQRVQHIIHPKHVTTRRRHVVTQHLRPTHAVLRDTISPKPERIYLEH